MVPLCALAASSVLVACGEPEVAFPVRARVIVYEGSDAQTETPRFSIAERTLDTLQDVSDLRGRHHRILRNAEFNVRAGAGSVIRADTTAGEPAALRFSTDAGVVIARDYPSLVMLSAYHQYEIVLGALPRIVGWTADEEVGRRGPFDVFFEPKVTVQTVVGRTSLVDKQNAGFVVGSRKFMLARRSASESIPFAADLRVIAHEFGHSLFETVFLAGDRPVDCQPGELATRFAGRLDAEFAVAGFNEGFADLVSFAVSGTTSPLSGWPVASRVIERSLRQSRFTFDDLSKDDPPVASRCRGAFYCLGTLFARSVLAVFIRQGGADADAEARGVLSREVVTALGGTLARLQTRAASLPPPSADLLECSSRQKIMPVYDGQIAGAFLDAFVAGMPEARRALLCQELQANFGPVGFPAEQRQTCAGETAP
jgi:hypothetical protein